MKRQGAYIYTRVSTAIQTEGYSLVAQRQKILDYAKYRGFRICGEYSDAGFSGKNIAGRVQFQQMLEDIEKKKNDVQFVLVFKLSRFGRNAADVLSSLQFMQDYGVNLVCVEDNIDSSADSGKLMISVMSAMAEIERENILVQTMAGRRQKASCGGWNGGFAPYGYELKDGQLVVAEEEARTIADTFELYIGTNKGATYVAKELNKRYTKKVKLPNDLNKFTTDFVKRIIDNPVYCGKIAYGRTVNAKIEGKRNEFHRVVQKDARKIILADGTHQPIVSEETWWLAHKKRKDNAFRSEKENKGHDYILSGLVRCPNCGNKMYGRTNGRKMKKDGTYYEPSYSYVCRTHFSETGVDCPKAVSYAEKPLIKVLRDVIVSLIHDDGFHDLVERSLVEKNDAEVLAAEIETAGKELRRLQRLQEQIENQLNAIDYDDKNAAKQEESYNKRLYRTFSDISEVEARISCLTSQVENAKKCKDAQEDIYGFLEHFEEIFDMMDNADKRDFLKSFIRSVEVYPKERRSKGQWIKTIHFNFPMRTKGEEMIESIDFDQNGKFLTLTGPRGAGGL